MSFTRVHARRGLLALAAPGALVALTFGASAAVAQTNGNGGFAVGSVTSVHGTSVQVSNTAQNSESTVTLQASTQYTKRETATASAVTVGTCVRVLGTGSTEKGITAQTVAVSPSTPNGCAGPGNRGTGGPGARGEGFRGANGQRPRNFGNRAGPNGANNRTRGANFAVASGPVVSVDGDSVVVKSTSFVRPNPSSSKSKTSTKSTTRTKAKGASTSNTAPKTATSDVKVELTSTSQISQTVSASATDVTVGACVTATGTSSGGVVDANRVAISDPVNGQCLGGFGGFGRFGGGTGGSNTGTGSSGKV
jgi:hypothetical protein